VIAVLFIFLFNLFVFFFYLFVFVLFLAAASDTVYRWLAHGRWFCPGTPASFTTKTVGHDIAEILLKVALNTQKNENIKSTVSC
jgi:hypothetical protein